MICDRWMRRMNRPSLAGESPGTFELMLTLELGTPGMSCPLAAMDQTALLPTPWSAGLAPDLGERISAT
jgi:hypothetical protein